MSVIKFFDFSKKSYDCIFSIGEACSCAQALKYADLRCASYPFDWLAGTDFLGRVKILVSDFYRFIEKEDLVDCHCCNGDTKNPCDVYKNEYTNLVLNHDFPSGVALDDAFVMVAEKYKRRIGRLLANISNADKVLVVYIETPICEKHASNDDILLGWQQICDKYPNKKIDLLYFSFDANLAPKCKQVENLGANVIKITANYKSQLPDAVPCAVDKHVLHQVLKRYKLKMPLVYSLKRLGQSFLIKLIPIKSVRKKLKRQLHL